MSQLINYPFLAAMVFNTPLYATPEVLASVKSVLIPRITGKADIDFSNVDLGKLSGESMRLNDEEREASQLRVVNKVAIIPVHGVLVSRRGAIDDTCSELVSYERLRTQITVALNNELVEEIALDFHTGGGSAMGCLECANFIRQSASTKPITAIVNFAAYSAGYFLASACSRIVCSPTGGVGSVGVIMETFEVSKWEDEMGIKYNTFYRGAHKNDGSPHEPISDSAAAEINSRLDITYDQFVGFVAESRGIEKQSVIDTQARLLTPNEALSINFIDEILPAQDAINTIAEKYISSPVSAPSIGVRASAMNIESQL